MLTENLLKLKTHVGPWFILRIFAYFSRSHWNNQFIGKWRCQPWQFSKPSNFTFTWKFSPAPRYYDSPHRRGTFLLGGGVYIETNGWWLMPHNSATLQGTIQIPFQTGKGTSYSKMPFEGLCYFPGGYILLIDYKPCRYEWYKSQFLEKLEKIREIW